MDKTITKVSKASNVDRTRNMFWGRGTVITAPEAFFEFYGGSNEFDTIKVPSEFGTADKLDLSHWKDPRMSEVLLKKAQSESDTSSEQGTSADNADNADVKDKPDSEESGEAGSKDVPAKDAKRRGRPPGSKKSK